MACSIERQKQIVEAAKSEYKRLAQLQKQGYDSDLENDIYDIAEAMNNMRAIIYKKPENIVESEVTPIDETFINELNNNKPKDGKANIQIMNIMFGTLLGILGTVYNYHRGSSNGSAVKSDILNKIQGK